MSEHFEEIFDQVVQAAREEGVRDVEAMLTTGASALTRFANNTIHQNVAEHASHISVRALIDGRTARASANRFDAESIRRVTREAIGITRLQTPDPSLLPMAEPQRAAAVNRFFHSTAGATPADRAAAVKQAIDIVESQSLTAAGIFSTTNSTLAILN